MGIFEYLGVLISVIMGLGITHLAVGASKLIQNRRQCKLYLPHAIWTINVLLYFLVVWWGMFWWSTHEHWSAFEYLFITSYAIVMFLMSAMLYPFDMDKDIDVEAYFFDNRRWFFSLMILAFLLDIPETLSKGTADLRAVPTGYLMFIATIVAYALVGIVTNNRIVHVVLPIAWFATLLGFLGSTTLREIAIAG